MFFLAFWHIRLRNTLPSQYSGTPSTLRPAHRQPCQVIYGRPVKSSPAKWCDASSQPHWPAVVHTRLPSCPTKHKQRLLNHTTFHKLTKSVSAAAELELPPAGSSMYAYEHERICAQSQERISQHNKREYYLKLTFGLPPTETLRYPQKDKIITQSQKTSPDHRVSIWAGLCSQSQ